MTTSEESKYLLDRLTKLAGEFRAIAEEQAEILYRVKAGNEYLRDISSKQISEKA